MSFRDRLPPSARRFTEGRWPTIWLVSAAAFALYFFGMDTLSETLAMHDRAALLEEQVSRQEREAARAPEERERLEAVRAWWREGGPEAVRAQTLEIGWTRLEEQVRARIEGDRVRVQAFTRISNPAPELIAPEEGLYLVRFRVELFSDKMAALAGALARLEDTSGLWLRLGNVTVMPLQRAADGARLDAATVYALIRVGSDA